MACNTSLDTDYCAGEWNLTCLKVGFTYGDEIEFTDLKGVAISISDDDFSWEITNSFDVLVATLEVGSGLTKVASNKLAWALGTPVTDAADIYTHKLIWTRPATNENFPLLAGTITVEV
jgi:hypothetical protein